MKVILNSVEKVNDFVNLIKDVDDNIDLCDRRSFVDAKSILGIFSLDLSRPLTLRFYDSNNQKNLENILSRFQSVN